MRIQRIVIGTVVLGVVAVAAAIAYLKYGPEAFLDLSQAELQEKLDPKFPQEKCFLALACLEIRSPKIQLTEGSDRVGLAAEFVASLGSRKMPGTLLLTGKPRYVQHEGSFFIDDIQIREFKMSGNAPDFDEVVRVRGPGLLKALMQGTPLYTLKSDTKYGAFAKLALKSVLVVNGKLRITFAKPTL
jgi:Protein of unknown function (DUF1439)